MKTLSDEMSRAYQMALENGGILYRAVGGFWGTMAIRELANVPYVGTRTVQALVERHFGHFEQVSKAGIPWRFVVDLPRKG